MPASATTQFILTALSTKQVAAHEDSSDLTQLISVYISAGILVCMACCLALYLQTKRRIQEGVLPQLGDGDLNKAELTDDEVEIELLGDDYNLAKNQRREAYLANIAIDSGYEADDDEDVYDSTPRLKR